jgi:thiamine biosynthesis protein ThiS
MYSGRWPHHKEHGLPEIHINGEIRSVSAGTVLGLVEELGLDVRKVAVELNLEIVPRSLHAQTELANGDRLELVVFVGGG